jgi:alkanesulfonate monooxygenase
VDLLCPNGVVQLKSRVFLWGAGTSAKGVQHSVELLDVYLSFANTPPLLGEKFGKVAAEAAKIGRTLEFGTRLQIIVRETEEEAWQYAQSLLDKIDVNYAIEAVKRQLPPNETFESYQSPNPIVQRNSHCSAMGYYLVLKILKFILMFGLGHLYLVLIF